MIHGWKYGRASHENEPTQMSWSFVLFLIEDCTTHEMFFFARARSDDIEMGSMHVRLDPSMENSRNQ